MEKEMLLITLHLLACSEDKDNEDTAEETTQEENQEETQDETQEEDTPQPEEEITESLDCETNIDADVPSFYQKYFQCVDITMNGDDVVISSDGLPQHKTYYYGQGHEKFVEFDTQDGEHNPNPNRIAVQNHSLTIPSNPVPRNLTINGDLVDGAVNTDNNEYGMGTVGLALDGISIFNSLAAPGDVIENEVFTFDSYNAHPEMSGNYHYHTDSAGPLEVLENHGHITNTTPGQAELEIYGMMCDGTVVMGCTELDGVEANNSDFDAQNGHVHDLFDEEHTHFSGRYHVHICTGSFTNFLFTPEIQYYDNCGN